MRVLHVVPNISQEASGPSYSVVRLCEATRDFHHGVTLATLDGGPSWISPGFQRTFPLGLGPSRLGRSPSLRRWLTASPRREEFDVVHNHSLWMMPNVYSCDAAWRHRLPLFVSPRGTLSAWAFSSGSRAKPLFWRLFHRRGLARAACLHATAETEYQDIRRSGLTAPVAVIPNGVDLPTGLRRNTTNVRTLLFLGRIHPVKGLDLLLPAWRSVAHRFPDWQLRIVGPGSPAELADLRRLVSSLQALRVEIAGPLYGDAKWAAYQAADAFVLPSRSENFGVSVAEALAAGTPAIVTRGAPWSELDARGAGWWIHTSAEALEACLLRVLAIDRPELDRMGQRGREWMAQCYSWAEVARKMVEVYEWVLGGRGPPASVRLD